MSNLPFYNMMFTDNLYNEMGNFYSLIKKYTMYKLDLFILRVFLNINQNKQ